VHFIPAKGLHERWTILGVTLAMFLALRRWKVPVLAIAAWGLTFVLAFWWLILILASLNCTVGDRSDTPCPPHSHWTRSLQTGLVTVGIAAPLVTICRPTPIEGQTNGPIQISPRDPF